MAAISFSTSTTSTSSVSATVTPGLQAQQLSASGSLPSGRSAPCLVGIPGEEKMHMLGVNNNEGRLNDLHELIEAGGGTDVPLRGAREQQRTQRSVFSLTARRTHDSNCPQQVLCRLCACVLRQFGMRSKKKCASSWGQYRSTALNDLHSYSTADLLGVPALWPARTAACSHRHWSLRSLRSTGTHPAKHGKPKCYVNGKKHLVVDRSLRPCLCNSCATPLLRTPFALLRRTAPRVILASCLHWFLSRTGKYHKVAVPHASLKQ